MTNILKSIVKKLKPKIKDINDITTRAVIQDETYRINEEKKSPEDKAELLKAIGSLGVENRQNASVKLLEDVNEKEYQSKLNAWDERENKRILEQNKSDKEDQTTQNKVKQNY